MLDELLGDERSDVRVVEDVVDGVARILDRALVGRQDDAVQQRFGRDITTMGSM
jgi:hypothetical protein